jgi:hypothetical protein
VKDGYFMRKFGCIGFFLLTINILSAQVERIYDEAGNLRTVKPINPAGLYEGIGTSYYPNGVIEAEIPYQSGNIHGKLRRYWPDGALKLEQRYDHGIREGAEFRYHPNGILEMSRQWEIDRIHGFTQIQDTLARLRLLAWSYRDSVVFAQYFDAEGRLSEEKVGKWGDLHLDTAALRPVRVFTETRQALQAGQWYALQVVIPGVPTSLVRLSCDHCEAFDVQGQWPYPVRLKAPVGEKEVVLYLGIKLRPGAAPMLLKMIRLSLES